nr:GNAT family N-acetyltransferase [Bacteroidota bacterium]
MKKQIIIRHATTNDHGQIWKIIKQVIASGDTYVFAPDSSKDKMINHWCSDAKHTYVAESDGEIVGTFFIKENFPDQGSHVANASYMTLPSAFGKGIGRMMGEFSLKEARQLGFKAMQFNIVVKSNERAIRLWKNLGFEIVGELPEAFNQRDKGLVDAYVMWRRL